MGSKNPDVPGPGLFDDLPPERAARRDPVDAPKPKARTPRREPAAEPPRPYTVSELTAVIDGRLRDLGRVTVEGEVSGFKRSSAGHCYFDLKDEGNARLSCKVWRSQVDRVCSTPPREGALVRCAGRLDVFAPRGAYSLTVDRMEAQGIGALLAQLEELKQELRAKGWFDRSRAWPLLPATVGVVTSRDGAALRDFLRTRSQRWPGYPVRLAHTIVQGPGAAREIAGAIGALAASGVDVVVVTRGGGSLEDLWAFNERPVAEAIRRSPVPVVSAVGHETDVCLSDFVADHRAHTPTDAAQTVIPDRAQLVERLQRAGQHLIEAVGAQLDDRLARLEAVTRRPVLRDPRELLRRRGERLTGALRRLDASGTTALARAAERLQRAGSGLERSGPRGWLERVDRQLEQLATRLGPQASTRLAGAEERLAQLARTLEAVGPLAVLERGYAIVTDAEGGVLSDAFAARAGAKVDVRLARGSLGATVDDVRDGEASE